MSENKCFFCELKNGITIQNAHIIPTSLSKKLPLPVPSYVDRYISLCTNCHKKYDYLVFRFWDKLFKQYILSIEKKPSTDKITINEAFNGIKVKKSKSKFRGIPKIVLEKGQPKDMGIYQTVGDAEHFEIILLYTQGLGYGKIHDKLNRSTKTASYHVHRHNDEVEKLGFCSRCKRLEMSQNTKNFRLATYIVKNGSKKMLIAA